MRARGERSVAIVLAVALSGCELVRRVDPLEAHPDVVAVLVMLVGGEREARILASHPHRLEFEPKPRITATLRGPGWTADFTEELPRADCVDVGGNWHAPSKCIGAILPEPIAAGVTYELSGTAPLGSFSGQATMPVGPELVHPAFALGIPAQDESGLVDVPLSYRVEADAGMVLADVRDIIERQPDGTKELLLDRDLGPFPEVLASFEADTISVFQRRRPLRFFVTVISVGRTYVNFAEFHGIDPLPEPWPDFGLTGEGVFGYFAGKTLSRAIEVHVGPFDNPDVIDP